MTTITCLSDDVINIILSDEDISIEDIVSLTSTCRRLYGVTDGNNVLWKKKLYRRWPWLKIIYERWILDKEEHYNFQEQVKASMKCRKELRYYLSQMSQIHYYKDNLSDNDMKDFNLLFRSKENDYMNYYFLLDELRNLLTSSSQLNYDLTQKYYAKKLLPYLLQYLMKRIWQNFIKWPAEKQLLERAVTFAAQWLQPQEYISHLYIKVLLGNITKQVLVHLKEEHPTHPILSTSTEQFSFWENNNINDNQWNITEGLQIIDCIKKTLFDELGFCIPNDFEKKYVLINHVLEKKSGNAMCLAIIFQSVARRLGIHCDIVYYPVNYFLAWKPKHNVAQFEGDDYFYIDMQHNGSIRSGNEGRKIHYTINGSNTNRINKRGLTQVISIMRKQMELLTYKYQKTPPQYRSLLELLHLIEPGNVETIENLSDYYMKYHMDLSNIKAKLKKIQDSYKNSATGRHAEMAISNLEEYEANVLTSVRSVNIVPKQKTQKIKFPVGSIVTFYEKVRRYNTRYVRRYDMRTHEGPRTGVIIGWDEDYNLSIKFDSKILSKRPVYIAPSQPFYKILCDDNKTYYISQGSLTQEDPKWIDHEEIGRYFCKFEKTHYVPNQMLTNHYPNDFEHLSKNT